MCYVVEYRGLDGHKIMNGSKDEYSYFRVIFNDMDKAIEFAKEKGSTWYDPFPRYEKHVDKEDVHVYLETPVYESTVNNTIYMYNKEEIDL